MAIIQDGSQYNGLRWVKSSLSFSNGACVEVAELPGKQIAVRDSKNPGGPVFVMSSRTFTQFATTAGQRARALREAPLGS